ncbi:MAG: hypothetical protein V3S24_15280 [Candidatus Tectomicrobia bacterium]
MGKSDYTFRHRIRNRPEYNRALVRRGDLTVWFDQEAVDAWRHAGPRDHTQPGRKSMAT